MTRPSGVRRSRTTIVPALALIALVATFGLTACGSTGVAGDGVVTSVTTPATPEPLSSAQLAAIVQQRSAAFAKAARAFRACDRKSTVDTNKATPCLKKAAAETAVADDALTDLRAVQVPAAYAATVKSLERFSAAGAAVAAKCTTGDQKCDQALARFRADEQSLLWDLDIQL